MAPLRTLAPSVVDVAAAAGVSTSTVSNVFLHPDKTADPTGAKVRAAAESLGYRPNGLARTVRGRRAPLVGVGLPGLDTAFRRSLLVQLSEEGWDRGLQIVSVLRCTDAEAWSEARPLLLGLGPLAMIWVDPSDPAAEQLELRFDTVVIHELAARDLSESDVDRGARLAHSAIDLISDRPPSTSR